MAGSSKKVVVAALVGNTLIAISKYFAAFFTGSAAMLAEAVHSTADTGNQALLIMGIRLSQKKRTEKHQFGRTVERYFWPFIVSLMLFLVGGVFAVYEGVHKLLLMDTAAHAALEKGETYSIWWNYGVLAGAMLIEGYAFTIALLEFRKEKGDGDTIKTLIGTKDPTIPVVILEDLSAMLGLLIALLGVLLTDITGWQGWDGLASLLIGVLLCLVAIFLALETHSLILGESASLEDRKRARELIESVSGIKKVNQLLSLHRGPENVLLAAKVALSPSITIAQLEQVINQAEQKVRDELPQMKHIFLEPDSDYDQKLDPELQDTSLP